MARTRPQVEIPKHDDDRIRWWQVGGISLLGLVIGIAWPKLAGVGIGPEVPGSEAAAAQASAANAAASAATKNPKTKKTKPLKAPQLAKPSASNAAADGKQTVVVGKGEVQHCDKGRNKLKGSECGPLRVDRVLVPRMQQLAGCPSALGLAGELELKFSIDFKAQEIRVIRGKRNELPSSTVNGIVACLADYISDVSAEKIPHKHSKYQVLYSLKFYPPGMAPRTEGDAENGAAETDASRGLASVTWDVGLVRDEPETGKVLTRLVRGTRVKLLGRKKDWYRVKVRAKEGWIYRGAVGM